MSKAPNKPTQSVGTNDDLQVLIDRHFWNEQEARGPIPVPVKALKQNIKKLLDDRRFEQGVASKVYAWLCVKPTTMGSRATITYDVLFHPNSNMTGVEMRVTLSWPESEKDK